MLDGSSIRVSTPRGQESRLFLDILHGSGSLRRRKTTSHGPSDLSETVPEFADQPPVLVERLNDL